MLKDADSCHSEESRSAGRRGICLLLSFLVKSRPLAPLGFTLNGFTVNGMTARALFSILLVPEESGYS